MYFLQLLGCIHTVECTYCEWHQLCHCVLWSCLDCDLSLYVEFVMAVVLSNVPPGFLCSGNGDDDEEDREERLPSCYDYVMHFLTVFWKVLFACVPPTEYWNGWACFLVSISVIGLLTAVIGDLASHFGCTVGLRDTVTAVVFVALGTSIPGEWKSCVRAGSCVGFMSSLSWIQFIYKSNLKE